MKRYWGIALTVLLVAGALLLPRGWFALRDASAMGGIHGEALDPLTVAQLDRGYERDIFTRLSAYLEAAAVDDVVCSQKDIDILQEEEALWENLSQALESELMIVLRDLGYYEFFAGGGNNIESCTQYVLMRKSDGQILLIANDILLRMEDGMHMEMLVDGADGTIYYMEKEENAAISEKFGLVAWTVPQWADLEAVEWMWVLISNYHSEPINNTEYYPNVQILDEDIVSEQDGEEWQRVLEYTDYYIRIREAEKRQSYSCLLAYGNLSASWSMKWEWADGENGGYRMRLGLYQVIRNIEELAERAALEDYWSLKSELETE